MTPAPPRQAVQDRTSRRIRIGGALLTLGTVQFIAAHLIVQNAWKQPTYSWWTNYISDLGATTCAPVLGNDVCSPLHTTMNTSFVLQGLLLMGGTVLSSPAWAAAGHHRTWLALIGVSGLSWVLVGLIPEDVSLTGHSIGALPIFILGNIALVVAGTSTSTRRRPALRQSALALGIIGLAGFALTVVAMSGPGGDIGIGGAERITVFPLQVWALFCGISLFARPGSSSQPESSPR